MVGIIFRWSCCGSLMADGGTHCCAIRRRTPVGQMLDKQGRTRKAAVDRGRDRPPLLDDGVPRLGIEQRVEAAHVSLLLPSRSAIDNGIECRAAMPTGISMPIHGNKPRVLLAAGAPSVPPIDMRVPP
ncbi:hypothetical protein RFM68_04625 [Mesorhizobium sp. MSK_1335]|uniref:Uncharacterized protein n=1 Tax=Mesorhizobium montanum TaxID=3072323 RepID=A0ABU4ZEL9_9HYPH|nr:hypothetical protein [Mesorhizobium sp. MSK_1335]MDX8523785.1 hypothetical protein [Mesorhizobium sp. MSK_1335]